MDLTSLEWESLGSTGMEVHQYSWRSGVPEAWFGAGSLICEGIGRVTAEGAFPLDEVILDEGGSFSLGDTLRSLELGDCPGAPRAGLPDWEPEGSRVIFFVSAPGGTGEARFDAPWSLWLYDAEVGEVRRILSDIVHPWSPRWSPDGRVVAFGGRLEGQVGTYLIDIDTGSLQLLSRDRFVSLTWHPDGQRVFGVVPGAVGAQPAGNDIVVVTVDR